MKPAKSVEFLLPAKGQPWAPMRWAARAAIAGVVTTWLRYLLSPFLPEWLELSGLLLLISAFGISLTKERKYSPAFGASGIEIWKYFPGPWRVQPIRTDAEAASWPAAGQTSWASDIKDQADFGPTKDAVIIIGSGLAGLSAAAALHKAGIPAMIFERESGPRNEGSAITMWPNAFCVFNALGVADLIRADHPPVTRVELTASSGAVLRSFGLDECPGGPHDARIVRRNAILRAIESKIPEGFIKYGVKVASVRGTSEGAVVELADGRQLPCRAVVGCDGVRSRIAAQLGLPPALYAGEVYYRGLAYFPEGVPEGPGTLRMMWGNGTARLGISTLSKNECFWFTTKSCPEDEHFATDEERRADALATVKGWGCHIEAAIRNTPPEKLSRNRIQDRWLQPGSEYGKGCVTVAGDALHPMTPTLGQGGCTALEDGVRLALVIQQAAGAAPAPLAVLSPAQLATALRTFEKGCSSRVAPIIRKSYNMAWMLQLPYTPVCLLRNWIVKLAYPVTKFLEPANFDPGHLRSPLAPEE